MLLNSPFGAGTYKAEVHTSKFWGDTGNVHFMNEVEGTFDTATNKILKLTVTSTKPE